MWTSSAGLTAAETRAVHVAEVVRHTDSGSGSSQAEHWRANVSMPDDQAWEGDEIREDGPAARRQALCGRRINLSRVHRPKV